MRFRTLLSAIVVSAALCGAPAAAQEARMGISAGLQPLPAALAPQAVVDEGRGERDVAQHFFRSMAIGGLIGAGTGAVIGFATAEDCDNSGDLCIFSREEEILLSTVFGGALGVAVGGVYGLVTGTRDEPRLSVVPRGDGMHVSYTVRH